jgi:hypothetical protein
MLLLLESIDMGRCVVFIDASFSAISLNIGHLVNSQGVLFVEWDTIESFACSEGFSTGSIFDECESIDSQ